MIKKLIVFQVLCLINSQITSYCESRAIIEVSNSNILIKRYLFVRQTADGL